MAQWGQQQPGFQYPMQTGFPAGNPGFQQGQPQFQQQNPQFQQQNNPQFQQQQQPTMSGFGQQPGGIMPQRTGFPGMQPGVQPQMTGFPGGGMMQAQPTGFPGGAGGGMGYRAPPPVPPLPTQFQGQNQGSGFLQPQQQQPNRFLSPSPGLGGPGLSGIAPQPTGFPAARPLAPQMTGFIDPKLQMMSSTFMPMNPSMPYSIGGAPQLPSQQLAGGMNLQQSFQAYNQEVKGTAAPKVPWALSKAEKKSYDQVFRAWDKDNSGFINGQTALEVFGQSGLGKDDLARIWTLADIDDRGMLNLPEFHVAMGLIYRKLSGNEIPDQLPEELVPPSARNLGNSVDFLKDVLKNETRSRSPSGLDGPISRLKDRSFHGNGATIGSGRDATIYKHEDSPPPGGVYQSRKRHVDRDQVRSRNDVGPSGDLQEMKNMLANTAKMLDRTAEEEDSKTAEDEALEREMEDLRYRVKRVSDDLDYVSRGPRTTSKDEERRKLERELLALTHERVPELERRIKAREERKEREKRQWARDRDRTNDRHGRYDDRDREDRYNSPRYEDRDRPYSRGGYRDREYDDGYRRRSPSRDRDRDRSRDRYERPRSPVARATPPPAPPSAPPQTAINNPPPAPRPPSAPAATKSMAQMTKEERQAEVQRRIEARKAALGIVATPSQTPVDTSVEDRLVQEKREAEEKARIAEKEAEDREAQRKERLDREKAAKAEATSPLPPATPTKAAPPPPAPRGKAAPPPPKPRGAPAAPAPRATPKPPAPVAAPAPPSVPEVDPEEEAFRARQEAIRKQREAREEALRKMEEDARLEEEAFQAKIQALKNRATPAPATPVVEAPPPPPPPAPPAAPPPPAVSPPAEKPSTNPFSRLIKEGGGSAASTPAVSSPPVAASATNPWSKPAVATTPTPPPPSRTPRTTTPVPIKSLYQTAPAADDDDWDVIKENDADEDDSSDDEVAGNRAQRLDIANKLFKGLLPSAPATPISPSSATPPPAPAAPPPPPAPAAPPPPAAPAAPPPPPAATGGAPPAAGRGALLSAIQGGARLRATKTVDKSAPPVSGKVIGDVAPPPHINVAPSPPSPPQPAASLPVPAPLEEQSYSKASSNRQSVDWYAGLASESQAGTPVIEKLPSTMEEDESEEPRAPTPVQVPDIQVEAPDALSDIDKSRTIRVRSLYAFDADGPDDLSFAPDMIIEAHPSKSGGDWWQGTLIASGKSGMFPQSYVEPLKNIKATALYTYEGTTAEELTFSEGEKITIIDNSEPEWWKAEQGGMVFIVPAAYLEVAEATGNNRQTQAPPQAVDAAITPNPVELEPPSKYVEASRSDSTTPTGSNRISEVKANPADVRAEDGEDSEENDSDSESGDSDYMSFESSDDDDEGPSYPETKAEREARAHERQLVLEAAGLILKQDVKPPPRPPRRSRSKDKRRPPPLAPQRTTPTPSVAGNTQGKELPQLPPAELEVPPARPRDPTQHLNDAFDRYEAFRGRTSNRLSVASFESGSMSPMSASSMTPTTSKEGDSASGKSYSGFLHFLGRSRTPVENERRSTLVISAPIMNTEISSGGDITRSVSPAFGSSWASLVEKTALEGIPTGERKRQEAIFELISTESAYVHDLQLIVELFYQSMLPLLDMKAVTVIFANIEDILITNTTFMSALEERQKECRLYIDRIGDVVLNHMSNMAVYMEYCVNQSNAIKILQSLRESKPELASHLQHLREDPAARNLDLSSYLLIPMQRITRYPLLIKQILHYTEPGDEHESIRACIDVAERILEHLNETIREQEGREVLKSISENLWIGQGRLDLTAPTRNMGQRKLLREGILCKAKSGRRLHAYLCSDILVLTDATANNLYRMPISLTEAQVKMGNDDIGFQITLPYPRGGQAVGLRATSVRDCQLWIQAIELAGRKCRDAEKKAASRKHRTR